MGFIMDKRWIYILIIMIIGVTCLYIIVDSSEYVGCANVNVNTFTVTLPSEFNIYDKTSKELIINNRKTQEKIKITDLGKGNSSESNITKMINTLSDNDNVTFIEETTLTICNETFPSIYYEKTPDLLNRITLVYKYGHLFSIDCSNFHDNETININTGLLTDSLKPDYKQKQD